ncbi:hypothetical protein Val02_80690 [Virgisporangium aliadipatigenens]|uniref:Ankyrin repeat domain-containing protein n=1 Tax=Virgisporangium aliadipatigenens TaxID=741659 RepID=A0A8J3YVB3_9ACTN|nr:hypothetical protein [Virgisporangium aliadipatigenens]GIJ51183.1 hypothetical protein Val02_80690 [Virgisporangium aliadipatigenens]
MEPWLTPLPYRLPAGRLAEATALRESGDRRGACDRAGVVVDVDLRGIGREHGPAVAGALEEDLAHLVPDLLRWHFPRDRYRRSEGSLLETASTLCLAAYSPGARLFVEALDWPQRLRLYVSARPRRSPARVERWEDQRHLWDVRRTAELRQRIGGGERAPFFHRDGTPLTRAELPTVAPPEEDRPAWTEWLTLLQFPDPKDPGPPARALSAAGIRYATGAAADPPPAAATWRFTHGRHLLALSTLAAEALRASAPRGGHPPEHRVRGWAADPVLTLEPGGGATLWARHGRHPGPDVVRLPRVSWQAALGPEPPRPEHLHPLVQASLFPDLPGPHRYAPPRPDFREPPLVVTQWCGGGPHRLVVTGGTVHLTDHTAAQITRERVLTALGGRPIRCLEQLTLWRGGFAEHHIGNWPRHLRRLLLHTINSVRHGDAGELLRLLDAGLDPTLVRPRHGGGLLHLLACLHGADAVALVGRLVAAGLDPNEPDGHHRRQRYRTGGLGATPLHRATRAGAAPELLRALRDAGADR